MNLFLLLFQIAGLPESVKSNQISFGVIAVILVNQFEFNPSQSHDYRIDKCIEHSADELKGAIYDKCEENYL